MQQQLESYTNVDISGAGNDAGAKVLELKLKALILDIIHAIDVIEQLLESNCKSIEEWEWQKQLRFVSFNLISKVG